MEGVEVPSSVVPSRSSPYQSPVRKHCSFGLPAHLENDEVERLCQRCESRCDCSTIVEALQVLLSIRGRLKLVCEPIPEGLAIIL